MSLGIVARIFSVIFYLLPFVGCGSTVTPSENGGSVDSEAEVISEEVVGYRLKFLVDEADRLHNVTSSFESRLEMNQVKDFEVFSKEREDGTVLVYVDVYQNKNLQHLTPEQLVGALSVAPVVEVFGVNEAMDKVLSDQSQELHLTEESGIPVRYNCELVCGSDGEALKSGYLVVEDSAVYEGMKGREILEWYCSKLRLPEGLSIGYGKVIVHGEACGDEQSDLWRTFLFDQTSRATFRIEDAAVYNDEEIGDPYISLHLNKEDSSTFEVLTEKYVGKRLSVVVGGTVYSTATVNERIPGGSIHIGSRGCSYKEKFDDSQEAAVALRESSVVLENLRFVRREPLHPTSWTDRCNWKSADELADSILDDHEPAKAGDLKWWLGALDRKRPENCSEHPKKMGMLGCHPYFQVLPWCESVQKTENTGRRFYRRFVPWRQGENRGLSVIAWEDRVCPVLEAEVLVRPDGRMKRAEKAFGSGHGFRCEQAFDYSEDLITWTSSCNESEELKTVISIDWEENDMVRIRHKQKDAEGSATYTYTDGRLQEIRSTTEERTAVRTYAYDDLGRKISEMTDPSPEKDTFSSKHEIRISYDQDESGNTIKEKEEMIDTGDYVWWRVSTDVITEDGAFVERTFSERYEKGAENSVIRNGLDKLSSSKKDQYDHQGRLVRSELDGKPDTTITYSYGCWDSIH